MSETDLDSILVSAVIPTYNYGAFVEEAVESALGQTHRRMEVIVVDDGSTDDTAERLARYGDRIRVVWQENRGLSAARNRGIREARGEWVALLDSDDVWHRDKTRVQLRALGQYPDVRLIGSTFVKELSQGDLADPRGIVALGVEDLVGRTRFGPSSAMIRRDCLDEVGYFDESLRSVEDRDMWLRIAARYPVVLVDSPCWLYRTHPNQMNRHANRMHENYRRVLRSFFGKHPEYSRLRPKAEAYECYDAAWAYFCEGARWRSLGLLFASIARHPTRIPGGVHRVKLAARVLMGDKFFGVTRAIKDARSDGKTMTASSILASEVKLPGESA
jgi:glycosyltransferase involved in cell wall biosynthesis